ncbi:BTAD domain-containing putative transcriptional regulator [Kitasatospora sp. NPDC002227]|uniref:AfsR/SARP family transcriptional regulator n=1 Tax=Kitasatospora sp. NPDC002227 TaxID=3154773 RepID=UPI00331A8E3F
MTHDAAQSSADVRFGVLGPVRGWRAGQELDLGPPQQRAMLVVLALQAGRAVGMAELTDAIWGEEPPARSAGVLRSYAWRLRTVLEPERQARRTGAVLVSAADGYLLRTTPEALDSELFEQDVAAAHRSWSAGGAAEAHARFAGALDRWDGTALAGVPGPYAERQRDRLTELRLRAQEDLYDCALQLGLHQQSAAELRVLTAEHPLRERPRGLLMLALYRSGRQAEALAVYAETRRLLAEELGVDPGTDLAALHTRILRADPALTLDVPEPRSAPARPARADAPVPRQLPADLADFTGRSALVESSLDWLAGRGAAADEPGSRAERSLPIAVFSGIGGVGKTSLAVRLAHRLRAEYPDGQLYVDLRGASPAPAAAGTVLAHFLQSLGVAEAAIPEDVEQRAAQYRSLLAERRVLVLLDNARDAAQLRPLLPGGAGCAVLVTTRSRALLLSGARQVDLTVLDESEALRLLAAVVGPDRVAEEPEAAAELTAACGQLPLAIRIAAARAAARPGRPLAALLARLRDEQSRLDELKADDLAVEACFQLGYEVLSPELARSFRLLALADSAELPLDAVAALLGTEEWQAEQYAEDLVDAGLLELYGFGRYRYHDLIRLYARRLCLRTDPRQGRQAALDRLLDHLLATAVGVSRLLEPTHALLRHLQPTAAPGLVPTGPAGASQWLRVEHELLSTVVAAALREVPAEPGEGEHGVRQAVDLLLLWFTQVAGPAHRAEFRRLIECAVEAAESVGALGAQARAHYLAGRLDYGTDAYEPAAEQLALAVALAERAGDDCCRFLAANTLGALYFSSGRSVEALPLLRLAKELAEGFGDQASASRVLATTARVLLALGEAEAAVASSAEAVRLARAQGDGVGTVLYSYGCVLRSAGRPDESAEQLTQALAEFRQLGKRDWESLCLARLAECRVDQGRYGEAAQDAAAALRMAEELGKAYCQGLAHTVLGVALPKLPEPAAPEEAAGHLDAALRIFTRLGAPEAATVAGLLAAAPGRERLS